MWSCYGRICAVDRGPSCVVINNCHYTSLTSWFVVVVVVVIVVAVVFVVVVVDVLQYKCGSELSKRWVPW